MEQENRAKGVAAGGFNTEQFNFRMHKDDKKLCEEDKPYSSRMNRLLHAIALADKKM